jgi:hypothetical protein
METNDLELHEMKAQLFDTLATINRSFEQLVSALYRMEKQLDLGEDYAHNQEIAANDLWARINVHILARITAHELDDKNHYSRMNTSLKRRSR